MRLDASNRQTLPQIVVVILVARLLVSMFVYFLIKMMVRCVARRPAPLQHASKMG